MDKKLLDLIIDKLEKQDERADKTDIVLTEIKADLKEHMRRSIANEEANELTKKALDVHINESNFRLSKLESLKEKFGFLGWLLVGALGILETLEKLGIIHIIK